MSGEATMGGCVMNLDDNVPIRQGLPVGLGFCCWARFSVENNVYYTTTIYLHMNTTLSIILESWGDFG